MGRQLRFFIITLGAIGVILTWTYPNWRPAPVIETDEILFTELNEEQQAAFNALPANIQNGYLAMRRQNVLQATDLVTARLSVPEPVQEQIPLLEGAILAAQGEFAPVVLPEDETEREYPPFFNLYEAMGQVSIYQYADGTKFLRIENLSVVNGPQLQVLISPTDDPLVASELGRDYINLGDLKSPIGNQNYDIPRELVLDEYSSIVIFESRYQIVFGVANFG